MRRNENSTPLVVALTDYGQGAYVALLQAATRYPAVPQLTWIDLDHGVALGDVRSGALTLRRTVPHLPPCVCVAVVDPGVGTERRAVALSTASGHRFVGPDNGLLEPVARRLGGAIALVDLDASPLRTPSPARTFDGRDLFGPVAGALAAGAALHDVGTEADPGSLVALAVPAPRLTPRGFSATVLEIDHFGTLVIALDDQLAGVAPLLRIGRTGEAHTSLGARDQFAVGRTFADVPHGDLVLLRDSDGALALARRDGSAAALLHAAPGDAIVLRFTDDDGADAPEAA